MLLEMKYLFTIILISSFFKLHAQEYRVNNSFIIMFNDKILKDVYNVKLTMTGPAGKATIIPADYVPGDLFAITQTEQALVKADSVRNIQLSFDYNEFREEKRTLKNYKISILHKWLKAPYIILRIADQSATTYKYAFEVPGMIFGSSDYVEVERAKN
jgi:hypothetical protein